MLILLLLSYLNTTTTTTTTSTSSTDVRGLRIARKPSRSPSYQMPCPFYQGFQVCTRSAWPRPLTKYQTIVLLMGTPRTPLKWETPYHEQAFLVPMSCITLPTAEGRLKENYSPEEAAPKRRWTRALAPTPDCRHAQGRQPYYQKDCYSHWYK